MSILRTAPTLKQGTRRARGQTSITRIQFNYNPHGYPWLWFWDSQLNYGLALIYRMLFPGGFCFCFSWSTSHFRVYGAECIFCIVYYFIRPFASDLLPYFPDPETRSSQHCHCGSPLVWDCFLGRMQIVVVIHHFSARLVAGETFAAASRSDCIYIYIYHDKQTDREVSDE